MLRNPNITDLDTTVAFSEHEVRCWLRTRFGCAGRPSRAARASQVGTERVVTKSIGMRHREGGWPKDVDTDDQDAMTRFRRKAEKVRGVAAALWALPRAQSVWIFGRQDLIRRPFPPPLPGRAIQGRERCYPAAVGVGRRPGAHVPSDAGAEQHDGHLRGLL